MDPAFILNKDWIGWKFKLRIQSVKVVINHNAKWRNIPNQT